MQRPAVGGAEEPHGWACSHILHVGLLRLWGGQAEHGCQNHKLYLLSSWHTTALWLVSKETRNNLRIDQLVCCVGLEGKQGRDGRAATQPLHEQTHCGLLGLGFFFSHNESHHSLHITLEDRKKQKNLICFKELSLPPFVLLFRAIIHF